MEKIKYSITEVLKTEYGLDVIRCDKINMGTFPCMRLDTLQGDFFLKIIDNVYLDRIVQEVNYIKFLKNKGIDVCNVIKNKDGYYYTVLDSVTFLVEEYENGTVFARNNCPERIIGKAVEVLGKIHKESKGYVIDNLVMDEKWIDDYLSRNSDLITNIIDKNSIVGADFNYRLSILDKIYDWKHIASKLFFGTSHGDYHCEQYSVYADRIVVFDFTNCAKLPLCWEVINSYIESSQECRNGKISMSNLEKYYRRYLKENKEIARDFSLAHRFYLLGKCVSLNGYETLIRNEIDSLSLEREKRDLIICKSIYENLERFDEYFSSFVLEGE